MAPERAPDDSILHEDISVERLVVIDNLPPFNDETVTLQDRQTGRTRPVREKKKKMKRRGSGKRSIHLLYEVKVEILE